MECPRALWTFGFRLDVWFGNPLSPCQPSPHRSRRSFFLHRYTFLVCGGRFFHSSPIFETISVALESWKNQHQATYEDWPVWEQDDANCRRAWKQREASWFGARAFLTLPSNLSEVPQISKLGKRLLPRAFQPPSTYASHLLHAWRQSLIVPVPRYLQ